MKTVTYYFRGLVERGGRGKRGGGVKAWFVFMAVFCVALILAWSLGLWPTDQTSFQPKGSAYKKHLAMQRETQAQSEKRLDQQELSR